MQVLSSGCLPGGKCLSLCPRCLRQHLQVLSKGEWPIFDCTNVCQLPRLTGFSPQGNCKFGMRCANEHITSDGRRVNKPTHAGNTGLGGRVMPMPVPPPPGGSLLTGQLDHFAQPHSMGGRPEDYAGPGSWKQGFGDVPNIETTFSSHPGSQYGSPPSDGRMPISPAGHQGLSIRDVGLPASFDSQGISQYAKGGPIPSSMPSRFGIETSPPSSMPRFGESSAVRDLRSSAFGNEKRDNNGLLASSPPVAENEPLGRRIMHSERFSTRPKMISSSVGARAPIYNEEWDDPNFALEEDLVPNSLHDLLTPQEKMRRFSRNAEEEPSLSHRLSLTGLGAAADSSAKVGSPSNASPSRFSALWSTQKNDGATSESPATRASAFGHVGSPLRNSSLHPGASPSLRAVSRPLSGDLSPFVSSPPRQPSMSMISQQLQRTRVSDAPAAPSAPTAAQPQHPGIQRIASGSSTAPSQVSRLDRAVSSSSVGREKIDEEQEPFPMDDEPQPATPAEEKKKPNAWKRSSGGLWALGKASPRLGPIGRNSGTASTAITKDQSPWNNGA